MSEFLTLALHSGGLWIVAGALIVAAIAGIVNGGKGKHRGDTK